jgi:hypothetical protein
MQLSSALFAAKFLSFIKEKDKSHKKRRPFSRHLLDFSGDLPLKRKKHEMEASRNGGGIPEDVQKTVGALEKAVDDVEKHIESYLKTSVDEITSDLSTEDGARLSVLLAYALNTLFYSTSFFSIALQFRCRLHSFFSFFSFTVYLKTQGVDPADHPVKEEIVRAPTQSSLLRTRRPFRTCFFLVCNISFGSCRSESRSTFRN